MIILLNFKIRHHLILMFLLLLNGCALSSHTTLYKYKPKSPCLSQKWPSLIKNSSYQENEINKNLFEPLFEDYRPHNVGDTITVILQESISASNNSSNNLSHNENTNLGVDFGNDRSKNNSSISPGLNGFVKNDFVGSGSSFSNNKFTGLITVTINDILSNGNLVVSGEKKISVNSEVETIHFSGIINPRTISKGNSVVSTQIANAHIEYKSEGFINKKLNIGWLQRLILSIFSF
ncbi:MAG: flagellar basal body L-ring protein FlgH [Buchnera aphidicola (Nurudea ibofushi)]